jgi:hypothetical protein
MRKTAAAPVAMVCAALLTLSGCGGGDEDEARDNIRTAVLEGDAGVASGIELTEEQADCFANGLVDEVGVEKLREYGLLDENNEMVEDAQVDDMSAEDADETAGVVTDCVDVKELIQEELGGAGGQLTDEQADCVLDAIDEDALEDALSAQLRGEGGNSQLQDSMGAIMQCAAGGQQ